MRIDDPRIIGGPQQGSGYIEDGYEINFNSGGTALIFKGRNSNGNPSIQPFKGLIDDAFISANETNQNMANGYGNGYLHNLNFKRSGAFLDTASVINYPEINWNPFYFGGGGGYVMISTSINGTVGCKPISCFFYTKGINRGNSYLHFIWKLAFESVGGGSFTDGNWSIPFRLDGSGNLGQSPTVYWPYSVDIDGSNYLDVSSTGLTGQWGVSISTNPLDNIFSLPTLPEIPQDGFLNFSSLGGWGETSRNPFNVTIRGILKIVDPNFNSQDNSYLHIDPSYIRSYGGTGTSIISLTGGFPITLFGSPPYFSYERYGVFTFNGTDDYISVMSSFNQQNFTISMWVKPGSSQVAFANIIDTNHDSDTNWVIQQNSSTLNQYYFAVALVGGGEKSVNFPAMTSNTWYHIAVTFSPSDTARAYLNGELVESDTPTGGVNINYSSSSMRIGAWGNGPSRFFKGSIGK